MAHTSKRFQIWQWACGLGVHVRTQHVMRRFHLNPQAASRHLEVLDACGAMSRIPSGQRNSFAYLANPLRPPHSNPRKLNGPITPAPDADRSVDVPTRRRLKFAPLAELVSPEFIEVARLLECAPLVRSFRMGCD